MVRSVGAFLTLSLTLFFSATSASANSASSASCSGPPSSSVCYLNFVGVQNDHAVGSFYTSSGTARTPDYNITFSPNFYALLPPASGGSGNFTGFNPYPNQPDLPAIFVSGSGSNVTGSMTAANGFSGGINFYYSAAFAETIKIWSGANGTGMVLATMTLAANDGGCTSPAFCQWSNVGLSFSGTGQSITFTGTGDGALFVDMELGQHYSTIPEPSSIYLLGTGLVGFCSYKIRRFTGV